MTENEFNVWANDFLHGKFLGGVNKDTTEIIIIIMYYINTENLFFHEIPEIVLCYIADKLLENDIKWDDLYSIKLPNISKKVIQVTYKPYCVAIYTIIKNIKDVNRKLVLIIKYGGSLPLSK